MSVAPHAGVVDFGTFTPPTPSLDGIQGEVPQPLIGQENYVLTGNGWSSLGALGSLTYQGTWDASTNTPTLVSSVGTQGYYYVVSVAGNTDLNGTTTWDVGDWAIFNGSTWQKIEGGTVGTFTNVITPQVTSNISSLLLKTLSDVTTLKVQDDTSGTPAASTLWVTGARNTFGRVSLKSSGALYLNSSSTNNINFLTGASSTVGSDGSTQLAISATTSAVNYAQFTGAATGSSPTLSMQGSDSLIAFGIRAKGNGDIFFQNNGSAGTSLVLSGVTSGVNYHQLTNSATTLAPTYKVVGTDTNISMAFQSKGTGAINLAAGSSGVNISNGGTVTATQVWAIGSVYTSIPSVAISAPTTAGGIQATANAQMGLWGSTLVSGGTGYTVNDIITVVGGTYLGTTAQQFRVTAVSSGVITSISANNFPTYTALPTSPVSVTGGTGSGATITLTWCVYSLALTNAGSGYIEQPTVTFSGGGGSGAAAYATIGSGTSVETLGSSLSFFTPGGETMRLIDPANTVNRYLEIRGGTSGVSGVRIGVTNEALDYYTSGGYPHYFATSGARSAIQFVINHISSTVNYLQATGSITGSATGPILSTQGSDTNVPMQIQGKGTGSVSVLTPTTLGGTTGNTAELFAAKGSNSNSIWLRAYQVRNATGTDWTTASLRLGQRIDATDMSYIEFNPSGFTQGIAIQTANNQPINFNTSGAQFRVGVSASSVNYVQAQGGATTRVPFISAQGSDTNLALALQSKGTGGIDLVTGSAGVNISNGGTVTNVTRISAGSGYTSIPSVAVSAPTITGGVQATLSLTMAAQAGTACTPANGGTGYTLNDVLTLVGGTFAQVAQFTVTGVSAGVVTQVTRNNTTNFGNYTVLPTSPAATTGGTGTGCTLNMLWEFVAASITAAGSGYVEQPTVTFSGGGGSGASAYATVGSGTIVRSLGSTLSFHTPAGEGFRVYEPAGSVTNYWAAAGAIVGNTPFLFATGSDTNVSGRFTSKGIGSLTFMSNGGSQIQFNVAHTASAVNYVQVTGAATGQPPAITAQGSDSNVNMTLRSKGTGYIGFTSGAGSGILLGLPNGSANYFTAASSNAGSAPILASAGSDTNISINLVPKGTGTVQQNGNPLAQVNHKYHAFTVGSYYFDSYEQNNYFRLFTQNAAADTIRYGAVTSPEYYDYGTLTWTAWAAGLTGIQNLLDGNPNTGMSVAHANRTFRFVVANSDGWPTNALVVLQTTWSAVTYTTATVTIASGTSAAGPFTTRQVMTFSSANSGNNWGMHAYYTGSIHTGEGFYQITVDITNWVDSGIYVTYPLINLNIFSNYSTVAGRMVPYSNSYDRTSIFIGGIRTAADVNGVLDIGRYSAADPTTYIDSGSNASRIILRTQYAAQVRISHTASAVNYLEFSGGSTGNGVTIAAAGSDTNINSFITSKGASSIVMQTNGRENFRVADGGTSVVNNLQAVGSNAGFGPTLQARGTDTNVDINLAPKGTGAVNLNTTNGTAFRASQTYLTGTAVNYLDASGRQTGLGPILSVNGSDTDIRMNITAKGTGSIGFYTNLANTLQMQITPTASAVNYVQVTGAATGAKPSITGQGSDSVVGLLFNTKSTAFHEFQVGSRRAFQIGYVTSTDVNYLQTQSSATNTAPILSAQGTDTDIDLALTPKGTGRVKYGTHTATADVPITGYIEIVDSGGTIRKLAVIT